MTTNENSTTCLFSIDKINKQEFVSKLTATMHNNGQTPINSLVIATAMLGSLDKLGMVSPEKWIKNVTKYIHRTGEQATKVSVDGVDYSGFDIPNWFETVVHAELMTKEGKIGGKLVDMVMTTEKALPAHARDGVTRRHPMVPYHNKYKLASTVSELTRNAIHALEDTQYCIDEYMLKLAIEVAKVKKTDEQYVIDGCLELLKYGNGPRVSEFKGDRRIRLYQSDNHGPNGQASDQARSFMNLHGVSTDYAIDLAIMAIREEMMDMIQGNDLDGAISSLRGTTSLVTWMVEQITLKEHDKANTLPEELASEYKVTKPWSFVKANKLLMALEKGEKPYIGMAFGLDAKCSGPQYGAIMTGDIPLAAACGFGLTKAEKDAYERAVDACMRMKIKGLTRKLIKKAYMGIFYGQGAMTFGDLANYGSKPKQHDPRLLAIIEGIDAEPRGFETKFEAQAKVFHAAIESSFGNMTALRKEIKAAHYHYEDVDGYPVKVMDTTKPTMHRMPDNSFIAMDYKVKITITGEKIEHDTVVPDVVIDISGVGTMKFEKLSFKTTEYNLEDYARSGFVNLIQGTDALVARHVIVAADELDCQHIIAVHDCFRVNINDFLAGKLHEAIKVAYKRVFVEMGTAGDILKDYFQGVRDAGGVFPSSSIAFMLNDGELKMADWLDVDVIIDSLANKIDGKEGAYYFAK